MGHPKKRVKAQSVEGKPSSDITINDLWRSDNEGQWVVALDRYWLLVKPADLDLVRELEPLDIAMIRKLDARGWFDFLHDKYFRWKYTAPNRLKTTRNALQKYITSNTICELFQIKEQLLEFPTEHIGQGLEIASSIRGLGIAGASGLLALMYPDRFATVDQFVVKALRQVEGLAEEQALAKMQPEGLRLADGVILIAIMREKARANNALFGTDTWTPKKIDEILWTYGR